VEFELTSFIKWAGYIGIFGIVFAESGLLFGFFLPGDSLLFTAGFLASQGYFDLPVLLIGCLLAAVMGDSVGYAFGYRVGRPLFHREESWVFKRRHLLRAEAFYQRYGGLAIVLARFLPVIRTFAPIVAGVAHMDYRTFLAFNVVGGLVWGIGVTLAGYFLGSLIPDPDRYLLPAVILIILSSAAPSLCHVVREQRHQIVAAVRRYANSKADTP
jgi:membrane-associated protein